MTVSTVAKRGGKKKVSPRFCEVSEDSAQTKGLRKVCPLYSFPGCFISSVTLKRLSGNFSDVSLSLFSQRQSGHLRKINHIYRKGKQREKTSTDAPTKTGWRDGTKQHGRRSVGPQKNHLRELIPQMVSIFLSPAQEKKTHYGYRATVTQSARTQTISKPFNSKLNVRNILWCDIIQYRMRPKQCIN